MAYRLNFLLVLALIACSLALVDSQHRARKLFIDLERAQTRSKELDIQWKQLQLDQLQLAKASMIDFKARRDLGMISAAADRTVYLTMPPLALRRQDASLAIASGEAPGNAAAQGGSPLLEPQTPGVHRP
jgi:cell division protein FtsL